MRFTGFERWASFQVAYDPGKELVLGAAIVAIAGLLASLFIRRRRIWVRAVAAPDGGTLVQVAGLAKTEAPGLGDEVSALAAQLGTVQLPAVAGSDGEEKR